MGPLTATTYAATTEVLEDIHIAGRLWTTLPLPTDTEIKPTVNTLRSAWRVDR